MTASATTTVDVPTKLRLGTEDLYGSHYPASWYMVMPARKLKRETVLPFDAFDRKWAVVRTASGEVQVFSRFCPHMGAPLHTGFVRGERLVCPFHRWEFEQGACKHIPYQEGRKLPKAARLDQLPTCEHLGFIWVFWGDTPTHSLPDLPEASSRKFGRSEHSLPYDVHMLSVLENGSDPQHFRYIHGVNFVDYSVETTHDEPHAFGFHLRKTLAAPFGRTLQMTTSIRYVGASMIYGTNAIGGVVYARFIAAPLPLNKRQIQYNLIVFPRRVPFAPPGLNQALQALAGQTFVHGANQDYGPIWSQMDPTAGGVMVAEDAHQLKFRRYYKRHLREREGFGEPA